MDIPQIIIWQTDSSATLPGNNVHHNESHDDSENEDKNKKR